MTPEGLISQQIKSLLDQLGIVYRRRQAGKIFTGKRCIVLGPEGDADFELWLPKGRIVHLEVKAEGGKTKASRKLAQAIFAGQVRELGHECYTVESIDDVLNALK